MNKYLQSFQSHYEILRLPDHKILPRTNELITTSGWFMKVGNLVSYIYFDHGEVVLFYDNNYFPVSENSSATYKCQKDECFFEFISESKLKIAFNYKLTGELFTQDPFPHSEEEDYNWGLFLANLINNPARRQIIAKEIEKRSGKR